MVLADDTNSQHHVRWFDANSGRQLAATMHEKKRAQRLVKQPNGNHFATSHDKGNVVVWNFDSYEPVAQMDTQGSRTAVAFSRVGDVLYTGTKGDEVQAWKLDGAKFGDPINVGVHVETLSCSPTEDSMLVGGSGGSIRVWDLHSEKPVGLAMNHMSEVEDVSFSPDGTLVATCGLDRLARIWDPVTGKPIGPPLRFTDVPYSLEWSPDSKTLVSAGRDNYASLWRAPRHVTGTAKEVGQLVQNITGTRIDQDGGAAVLAAKERPPAPNELLANLQTRQKHSWFAWETVRRRAANENWSGVLSSLTRIIQRNDEDSRALYERGRTHMRLRQYERAQEDLDRIVDIDPTYPDVFHQRAHVLANLGQVRAAADDVRKAIATDTPTGHLHLMLATYSSDPIEAFANYRKYIELDDDGSTEFLSRIVNDFNLVVGWAKDVGSNEATEILRFAERQLERFIATGEATKMEFYNLACIYSLLSSLMDEAESNGESTRSQLQQEGS